MKKTVQMPADDSRESLYADLTPNALAALWRSLHELVPSQPRTQFLPWLWRYDDIRPLLLRAGALISAHEAVRRVLVLENPGAVGSASISPTLYAGLQLILPGEVAPAHRHTQSAFRFIVEGQGAFTTVRGERFNMQPGDLILTPNFEWHDHGHEGTEPVVWLDGLDIPLVRALQAGFAETANNEQQLVDLPPGNNLATWGSGLRIPGQNGVRSRRVERFIYPFEEWRRALGSLEKAGVTDETGCFTLEFLNPVDGGSVLPTMSAYCQLLPAATATAWQRRTDALVCHVVEGSAFVEIDTFNQTATPRDTFVIPPWTRFRLQANARLVLFVFSDRITQERLDLWRNQIER